MLAQVHSRFSAPSAGERLRAEFSFDAPRPWPRSPRRRELARDAVGGVIDQRRAPFRPA